MKEDFYIGYLPKMPVPVAKVIKPFVIGLFLLAIGLAFSFWLAQKPFARSTFEFGTVREFTGTVQAGPVPFLLVEKADDRAGVLPAFTRFPLVGEGKHGVGDLTAFDGQKVTIKGTLIYRDELQMIEVAADSIKSSGDSINPAPDEARSLGNFTLKGEIVDSKCYLGVMNPGQSKPHRDCAVACLRGGIPPLFIVRDGSGNITELWLLSANGEAVNDRILDFVAEPIEVSGEVSRRGDQLFFRIDPVQIKRLP